jgi:hypothetical protein
MRRDAWKTLYIFQWEGSNSLYATFDIWATTSKGPYCLGASFGVKLLGNFRLVASSQTLELIANGVKHGLSLTQESCAFLCASWAALLASLMAESHCSREGTLVFLVGWWIFRV